MRTVRKKRTLPLSLGTERRVVNATLRIVTQRLTEALRELLETPD
jgi:hypothetical protein